MRLLPTAGLLVAIWARSSLVALAPSDIPRLDDTGIDLSVLLFTVGVSVVTDVLFGIVNGVLCALLAWNYLRRDGSHAGETDTAQAPATESRRAAA